MPTIPALPTIERAALPAEAHTTLGLIDSGGPFPHAQDGIEFRNRESLLPVQGAGYYEEYTVRTPGVTNRGARRIVKGQGGELYTDDHYASLKRIVWCMTPPLEPGVFLLTCSAKVALQSAAQLRHRRATNSSPRRRGDHDKTSFLMQAAEAVRAPYESQNWDAFDEVLRDLEWAPAPGYVIVYTHSDRLADEPPRNSRLRSTSFGLQ